MEKKFYDTTWSDMAKIPFPLKWYREIFNLHHYTMSEKALDYWEEYRGTQFKKPEERKKDTDTKVQSIVRYAYENVPFYKELYDKHGVDISSIKTADDLQKLPLVDKQALTIGMGALATSDEKIPDTTSDKLLIRTSGSTGSRMSFTCDAEQLNRRWAVWMRQFEWTGWKWGDKEVRFWFKHASTVKNPRVEALDAFLVNRNFYEFENLNDDECRHFCEKILEKEPYIITGYWEAIETIAKYAYRNNISLKAKAIIPSTQVLSDTGREIVEKVFGAKIFDKYASAEFSSMGLQCEQNNFYHIQTENIFLEILKDGKRIKNGIGEAIVTDLSNRSTPLIRYRVGDILEATEETCDCSRTLPVFKKPLGRIKNIIKIGDRIITESELAEFEIKLWEEKIADRIKFIQNEDGTISVTASQISDSKKLKEKIKKFSGIDIDPVSVDVIDHFRGKRHRGESKITDPFNNNHQ